MYDPMMYAFGEVGNPIAEDIQGEFRIFTSWLDSMVPDGREKSLALTNLQQAWFWADHALTLAEAE